MSNALSTGKIIWLVAFSIAMGFLETAVVVYLRELYYPNGFNFPLVVLNGRIGAVEIFREAATVIMLFGVGVLTGNNARQKFACFLIAFAVWDLFYYVFLKVILNWPESMFTWDILFLIPAPWVGPVLSPVIICFTMIALAIALLIRDKKMATSEWVLLIIGSLIVIISWMWDYIAYSGRVADNPTDAMTILSTYVPSHYNWLMFAAGELFLLAATWLYWKKR
ncbi:hypothetical protein WSM22_09710 [Cytophagales bacterium WSM2-2]|nr:hypothetical protein WSM22_09710 [Cytophagales bacterium WSM2-2]